uniref:Uncharacterized protein n=1 Tax=Anguilla anguilla TaxID=7936 RepID=A0A0E9QYJ4_ANGAN
MVYKCKQAKRFVGQNLNLHSTLYCLHEKHWGPNSKMKPGFSPEQFFRTKLHRKQQLITKLELCNRLGNFSNYYIFY